jgi:hypothetical protein
VACFASALVVYSIDVAADGPRITETVRRDIFGTPSIEGVFMDEEIVGYVYWRQEFECAFRAFNILHGTEADVGLSWPCAWGVGKVSHLVDCG